jgi:hypothetical protein
VTGHYYYSTAFPFHSVPARLMALPEHRLSDCLQPLMPGCRAGSATVRLRQSKSEGVVSLSRAFAGDGAFVHDALEPAPEGGSVGFLLGSWPAAEDFGARQGARGDERTGGEITLPQPRAWARRGPGQLAVPIAGE